MWRWRTTEKVSPDHRKSSCAASKLRCRLCILTELALPQLSIVSMAEVPPYLALHAFATMAL